MSDLGESVETKILQAQLGEHFGLYQKVNKLKHYQGIQVRMPQDIVIK